MKCVIWCSLFCIRNTKIPHEPALLISYWAWLTAWMNGRAFGWCVCYWILLVTLLLFYQDSCSYAISVVLATLTNQVTYEFVDVHSFLFVPLKLHLWMCILCIFCIPRLPLVVVVFHSVLHIIYTVSKKESTVCYMYIQGGPKNWTIFDRW